MRILEVSPHPLLTVGQIEARVAVAGAAPALQTWLDARSRGPAPFDQDLEALGETHRAIRRLLRHSGHKPSGRGKPASEYLASSALKHGQVRSIHPLVDVNNVVSLHSGIPMSLFDGAAMGDALVVRPGVTGESYVFNPSGQEIYLDGLLTVYRQDGEAWAPCGNAVKDSMATKVSEDTVSVVGILYGSRELPEEALESALSWYGTLLTEHCGAGDVETRLVEAPR